MYANTVSSSGLLLKVLLPECCRRQVAQPGLPPLAIVKHVDVLGDIAPGLLACCIAPVVDEFVLECSPETLDGRVIIAIPTPTHRCQHAELGHQRAVFMRAVLAAAVGVLNQAWRRSTQGDGPEQGLHHQVPCHLLTHCVANDFAGIQVLQSGQVQPALISRDIRQVPSPHLVRRLGGELLLEQVRRHRQIVLRIGRRLELAFLLAAQSQFLAQSANAMQANLHAMLGQIPLQPLRPARLAGSPVAARISASKRGSCCERSDGLRWRQA